MSESIVETSEYYQNNNSDAAVDTNTIVQTYDSVTSARRRIVLTAYSCKIKTNSKNEDEIIDFIQNFKETGKIYLFFKRLIDIVVSLIIIFLSLLVLWPFALAIKIESKGSVFFKQKRSGKNGNVFTVYKLRSMQSDAEAMRDKLEDLNERDGPVFKIKNDPRVTKVGAFLRKSCIDEIPQFINVLKGDMTIVGPRPPLPSEVDQYNEYQHNRMKIKPGLTCYWQVAKFREKLSFDEWVDLDVLYIRNRNIFEDIKIILITISVMFRISGDK